jgi:hypothetical protein
MNTTNPFEGADIISVYTRAQAIEDGVLVDLRQGDLEEVVENAGFKYPVACTASVYAECIALTKAAEAAGQDIKGRLWDVLWMLSLAIRTKRGPATEIHFTVTVSRDRKRPTPTKLVAVCGPGDDMEPVITIMFPGEQ